MPPPTSTKASYTLSGGPNACGNFSVNGTYIVQQGLSSFNTVDVTVDVTHAGDYSLHTDTVNGMHFSASGSFTNTGLQTVRLSGSGTPSAAGLFTFTPTTGSSFCTFDLPVQNNDPLAIYVLESGAGNPNPCIYTLTGTYKAQTPLNASNTISMSIYVQTAGNFTIQTARVNGMVFTATGAFTSTGTQYISLTGSGTPVAKGDFFLVPQIVGPHPLGGQSCAVKITVQ